MSRRITILAASLILTGIGCTAEQPAAPVSTVQTFAPAPQPIAASAVVHPVNAFGEVDGIAQPSHAGVVNAALRQHTFLPEGADADVSVDPTGQWIVYTSTRHNEHPKIYVQKTDGVSVTQLTTDDADEANPAFSPDGKKIAFASNRSGHWSIYVMDADGKNVMQVTNARTHDLHPSWSPDGTELAYSSLGARSGVWEIWTIELNTGSRKMIGEGLFPSWSPAKDVNKIAFQRARQRGTHTFSIWTLELEKGEPRRVTEVASSGNSALVSPSWSPDGKEIAFASVVETAPGTRQHDVWVIDADGNNRRRITDGVGVALSPVFAADGSLYYISDRSGPETVWSTKALAGAEHLAEKSAEKSTDTAAGADKPKEAHAANDTKESP
jgi:Tol biopolymer transport system component